VKKLAVITYFTLNFLVAFSQDGNGSLFRILSVKKSVTINGIQAKVGSSIFSEDVVELKEESSITMVNKKGQAVELKKEGRYKASFIDSVYNRRSNGRRPDGWRYPHDFGLYYYEPIKKEPRPIEFREDKIQILRTQQNYIAPTNLTFFWCLTDTINVLEYKITISTLFDEKIKTVITKENKIEIPTHELGLNNEPFLMSVLAINNENKIVRNSIVIRLAADQYESILQKFKSKSGDSEYWNKLGDECIEKVLPYNALQAYYKAYKISPEQSYRKKLENHINRYYENGDIVLKCFPL
jgi:hypothetical protein